MVRLVSRPVCLAIWRFMRRASLRLSLPPFAVPSCPPISSLVHPRAPPKSWFYLLRNQFLVRPVHRLMVFALASIVLSLVTFFLTIILIPYSMGRKKDSEATFRRARGKGCERNTGIVNNNPVLKKPEPQAERNYQRKLDLWDQICDALAKRGQV